jgi:hypothetical protein
MADEVPSICQVGNGVDNYCLLSLAIVKINQLDADNKKLKESLCRLGELQWC